VARVTLQTIADRLGVSRMTVSNAFSRPDQLSESLRTKILQAAGELGYAGPDPAGRALARGTTGAVGVLLTSSLRYAFDDEVATGFLSAVATELGPTGLAITLLSASVATA
jgi:DNA-binding LacI/PurR family transcriptional regulator